MSTLTKRALEASLKKLLTKKPLNKITINEIADDCGISRMTFYYHFRDIYDLMEWALDEDAKHIIDSKKTYQTWEQGFLRLFQAIQENRDYVNSAYHSISRERLEESLYHITSEFLMGVVREKSEGVAVREEDQVFIVDFYKYAFVGLLLDWIGKGMKEDPENIIERLGILVHGDIEKALDHYRTDRVI